MMTGWLVSGYGAKSLSFWEEEQRSTEKEMEGQLNLKENMKTYQLTEDTIWNKIKNTGCLE